MEMNDVLNKFIVSEFLGSILAGILLEF